jgi:hypothetical protein
LYTSLLFKEYQDTRCLFHERFRLTIPFVLGGFNPAEASDATALLLAEDGSSGYTLAKGLLNLDQIADAGFAMDETLEQLTAQFKTSSAMSLTVNTALIQGLAGRGCP